MNDELTNQLNMIGACITVADSDDHKDVWDGNEPSAFETDFAALKTDYTAARALQTRVDSAIGGATDAKADAEAELEDLAFRMARALANYYLHVEDLVNHGRVDIAKSDITRLRHQALSARAVEIRDLANSVVGQAAATARGVTEARVTALSAAIVAFDNLRNLPRGETATRSALRRELTTNVGALMSSVRSLDDLVLQFDDTPEGRQFGAAWKQARIIVDLGHGPKEKDEPVVPAPPAPGA